MSPLDSLLDGDGLLGGKKGNISKQGLFQRLLQPMGWLGHCRTQINSVLCPIPAKYLQSRLERAVLPHFGLCTGLAMAGVSMVPLAVPCHAKHTSRTNLHLSTHSSHLN